MHGKGFTSDRFTPVRVLSEGLLFQTVLGRDSTSGGDVVFKHAQTNAAIPAVDLDVILRDSYEATRYWRHPGVLVPFAGFERDSHFEIALRYIPDERRSELSSDLLRDHAAEILPQLFSAVEFIHLMGYVHCDLKSENIFVDNRNGHNRVLITDLDLVRPVGSKPMGKIIGTQPFIAPEVLEDDIFVAQSDYYSLGVILFLLCHRDQSLRERLTGQGAPRELAGTTEADCDFVEELKWLAPCVAALLTRHYQLRPPALLPLLSKTNPQLWPDRKLLDRELFWHDLRSSYRRYAADNRSQNPSPAKFARASQRIFGIPDEILLAVAENLESQPRRQFRILNELAKSSDLGSSAGSWNLRVPVENAKSSARMCDNCVRG